MAVQVHCFVHDGGADAVHLPLLSYQHVSTSAMSAKLSPDTLKAARLVNVSNSQTLLPVDTSNDRPVSGIREQYPFSMRDGTF